MTVLPLKEEKEEKAGRPSVQNPKRMPEFIEALRRREQSMKAGFAAATKRSEFNLEEVRQKEKEIVVVPPPKSTPPRR